MIYIRISDKTVINILDLSIMDEDKISINLFFNSGETRRIYKNSDTNDGIEKIKKFIENHSKPED